jgi:(1->4)-alpha-D-glucan 1-alpha-D-glucosylmutase
MTEPRDALSEWCERVGIALDYHDIWGRRHEAPASGRRALLAEFGIHDTSAQALAAARARDWQEVLPPALPLPADAPRFEVTVRVQASLRSLRWTVVQEDGANHGGMVSTAACNVSAEAHLDGLELRALALPIELTLPAGYHTLRVEDHDAADPARHECLLIVAPPHCFRPAALQGEHRLWGPTLQLYGLRSRRNWGIGDFGDLAEVIDTFAERGGDIVGLNPLHALFTHNPAHISPYSPSSRSQLNTIYLDMEALDDFRECDEAQRLVQERAFQERLARLRDAPLVDYAGVAAAKLGVLERLYAHFRERHLQTASERAARFRAFQAERGQPLRLHATFEALQEHFHAADASVWGWPVWPEAFRDPRSSQVQRFQAERLERIEYFEYLQWLADQQLAALSRRCRERGMSVGLYLDLAVSVDRGGSDTWGHTPLFASRASVGAPPDELNTAGQDWGLPPLRPDRLRTDGFRFFIDTVRGCMRHSGALRIDHVMSLMRLYWIAPGLGAREGAYIGYALREMLAVVTLESQRSRCMVIGEDLGTVTDEVRGALAQVEVLSYRLLYFERRDGGAFKAPQDYPRNALVAVGTHDLPTLAGWWSGRDLALRESLHPSADPAQADARRAERARDRQSLLEALQQAALLPGGIPADGEAPLTHALVRAIHAYAASAPSRVMMLQLDDALGVVEQANLPGTVNEHPNWRRKLPVAVEVLAADERVQALAALLSRLRPRAPRTQAIVPRATYRLQFNRAFTFEHAIDLLPYLARLGVSHVYCSPLMRARPGSTHGYDVVAHDEINPELGGRAGFDLFSANARGQGLGLLLDMVPNHMGVLGADNAWWLDVLENGPASRFAGYFDIDWHPVDRDLDGKVLLPVLGEPFGRVLDSGCLRLAFDREGGAFALHYFDHRFPLDPRSYGALLRHAGPAFADLATAFESLPARDAVDPGALAARLRDKELLKARLAAMLANDSALSSAFDERIAHLNEPDALQALHETQAYRLAYWRVAADEINYRRFFDINELAALRIEDPAVFEATQGFALDLAAASRVDGLRIDHPDGLLDPAGYFERLQSEYARRAGLAPGERDAAGRPARPLYVVAEKIAAAHESVPLDWALHGTTGYRFANVVNGVLVDASAARRFDRIWRRFSGQVHTFEETALDGKRTIVRSALASDLTMLATALLRIARAHRDTRDFTLGGLREALAEIAARMPVYRSYLVGRPSAQDSRYIEWAVAQARRGVEAADPAVFDFVRECLLGRAIASADEALRSQVLAFARRFQQFTAPVAAKGVEDTAFYRYNRLASLNEVGGDPDSFGISVRAFHAASADRATHWPHTILATSTHDNKRSEDVRARLDVLSEMPAAWSLMLRRFAASAQMRRMRSGVAGEEPMPSRADEYLLIQTLLGTLPASGLDEEALLPYRERIERYAIKAAREAKLHTSWTRPHARYEEALRGMVASVLARVRPNPLLTDLQAQADVLSWFGALNSLATVLLKFTGPGVPDLYQGNELMDLSLVDPDNRRPVDYARCRAGLEACEALAQQPDWRPALGTLGASAQDGRLKQWVTWRLLQLRRHEPMLFRDGGYRALPVSGAGEDHVIAYAREHEARSVVALTGRLFARLVGAQPAWPAGEAAWHDTAVDMAPLREGLWWNWLTGESLAIHGGRLPLAQAFATLPVAVLVPPAA